jgi:phosphatidylinositol-bisphosphatase
MICVFVRDIHLPRVRCVFSDVVGVGVMGMLGNKGGVSIRMQFYDSTICIVNSHLAAHRENVKGRNSDFSNILQKLNFKIGPEAVRDEIRNASLSHWLLGNASVGTLDHDLTFWMGDLNYRIVEAIETDMIINLCQSGTIDRLRPLDQLNIERDAGRVFQGFEEGLLTFAPTYKYQPGTDLYEQRPEKKIRAPAWCDRVLWYAQDPNHAKQLAYKRSELNVSDHKPVMSTFAITFKDIVQNQRKAVLVEVMNVLSRFENKNPPNISLDTLDVNFSDVRYNETVTKQLKIRNIGNAVAMFRFVPKPDEVRIIALAHFSAFISMYSIDPFRRRFVILGCPSIPLMV